MLAFKVFKMNFKMNRIPSIKFKTLITTSALLVLLFITLLIVGCIEKLVEVKVHVSAVSSGSELDENQTAQACKLEEKSLDIVKYPQETSDWCWAASAQTVINYHLKGGAATSDPDDPTQRPLAQCLIVDKVLGYSNTCCSPDGEDPGTVSECRRGYWPEKALDKFDFVYSEPERNPDFEYLWARITSNICADQPLIYEEHFIGGGAHSNVIYGYGTDEFGRWVDLDGHQSMAEDFQQVNFEYDLFFDPNRDHPFVREVWVTFDISPL